VGLLGASQVEKNCFNL